MPRHEAILMFVVDIARYFGSDVTPSAIQNACKRQVRPNIKLLTYTVAAGGDPKDLDIPGKFIGSRGKFRYSQHNAHHNLFCFCFCFLQHINMEPY